MLRPAGFFGQILLCGAIAAAAEPAVRFEKDVLPILTQRCGSCHGRNEPEAGLSFGDLAAATKVLESGNRAIVPGKPEESELLRRVTSSDESERMPSKGPPLSKHQIDKLRQWIVEGAQWPEHWAYRALDAPPVPEERVQGSGFGVQERNAMDAFVGQELLAKGLTPSPPADKRTLLRRVSFDLIGLPPTPEELEAFLADQAPDAYERVVDRLLASPRHGERWARHWMDVVHYAETHGHDQDRPRENAWPYRDYLIRAFNADVPYGRFIEEQIAGDVLWPEDTSAIVATGFLATGPWDESSLRDIREDSIDREIGRYLDRDDIVSTVVNTFLSTTVQCARCHDHKFDPISQQEYYGLQAVFAATDKANRAYDVDPAVAAKRRELIAARSKLREQKEQLDPALLSPDVTAEVGEWEKGVTAAASLWRVLTPTEVKSSEGSTLTVQSDGSVLAGGTRPEKDTYTLAFSIGLPAIGLPASGLPASGGREPPDGAGTNLGPAGNQGTDAPSSPMITGLRLEVLTDASLPKQGPGRQDNGNLHLNELVVKISPKDKPDAPTTLKLVNPRADFNQDGWSIDRALDGNADSAWGIFPEVGKPHTAIFEFAEPLASAREMMLTVELKQLHGRQHLIGRPRISITSAARPIPIDAPSLPAELASILTTPSDQRTDRQRADLAAFVLKLKYDRLLAALPPRQFVYAGTSDFQPDGSFKPADKPRVVHVLARGDIHQPGGEAVPCGLAVMPQHAGGLSIADPSIEGQRRAALARWIASPENALTWRSIANRLWHYHFGRGIVDTPNDFGRMGSFPSHPELLDWLAAELRDGGGELKRLHRRMVTSETYRQASGGRTKASGGREPPDRVQGSGFRVQPTGNKGQQSDAANPQSAIRNPQSVDADNRLLWRMNRARLDAESIHDAVAAISGTLDLKMGGPSVRQFIQTPGIHVTPNVDYQGFNVDDPANYRRSVYRFIFRTLPDPFMESLDCADSSQLTPVRSASVTALQALAMLNDKFIVRQSEHLAARLTREAGPGLPAQIALLFRLVLCREPTPAESTAVAAYAAKHGLANACRVLLNSNEFMFVD